MGTVVAGLYKKKCANILCGTFLERSIKKIKSHQQPQQPHISYISQLVSMSLDLFAIYTSLLYTVQLKRLKIILLFCRHSATMSGVSVVYNYSDALQHNNTIVESIVTYLVSPACLM